MSEENNGRHKGHHRGLGRTDFVEHAGLSLDTDAVQRVQELIKEHDLEVVRLSFADQHGILRGKALVADSIPAADSGHAGLRVGYLEFEAPRRSGCDDRNVGGRL